MMATQVILPAAPTPQTHYVAFSSLELMNLAQPPKTENTVLLHHALVIMWSLTAIKKKWLGPAMTFYVCVYIYIDTISYC